MKFPVFRTEAMDLNVCKQMRTRLAKNRPLLSAEITAKFTLGLLETRKKVLIRLKRNPLVPSRFWRFFEFFF